MTLGPIEVLVVGFPGNRFNGEILPELERLVEAGTIDVIDGLLVRKEADGTVSFVEFAELGADDETSALGRVIHQLESLISDEDVQELTDSLEPNSSAAILVFEHTWAKPFRDAIVESGGILTGEMRLSGLAVDELLDELAALD